MSIEARFFVQYPGFSLDLDLRMPATGITALFGASGSGKTTLLRCIAGLQQAKTARLTVNGEIWQSETSCLPTHRRPLGYVFQEASLFAHLNVADNLNFGLRRSGSVAAAKLPSIIELLGITHLLGRKPAGLSGGEAQRVAIARALLCSPKLLLMDEPLAALDHQRKQEILPYLESLHRELDIPVIYVSHSLDEVARLADHLILLEQGRVVAQGPLDEVFARSDLQIGFSNDASVVISAKLAPPSAQDIADCLSELVFAGGSLWVAAQNTSPGTLLRCRIHARDVSLSRDSRQSSILNSFPAFVREIVASDHPAHVLVRLDLAGSALFARITRRSLRQLALIPGERLFAHVKAVALLR